MSFSRFLQEIFGSALPESSPEPAARAEASLAKPVPFNYDDPHIPDTSRPHIATVLALIAEIESGAANEAGWSAVQIEIRQLSETHLPTLIKSYLDIPAAHRAEIFRRTGRSASFVLNEGLDKMADRLRAMSLSLAQGNIDAFTSTMRFIDLRYGPDPLSPD